MARIPALRRADLPESSALFEAMEELYGFVPASMLTMHRLPELAGSFAQLFRVAMRADGRVPVDLKWLMAHLASKGAECRYCQADTASNGMAAGGVPAAKLRELWTFEQSPLFSDAERVALRVAFASGTVPNSVTDDMLRELREHWDDDAATEIVGVLSVFGFLNRWNSTLATDLDAVAVGVAEEHLGPQGWDRGQHQVADEGRLDRR